MKGIKDIHILTCKLSDEYPIEGMHGSRVLLYGRGLKDGLITKEQYKIAKEYYGNLWYYRVDYKLD